MEGVVEKEARARRLKKNQEFLKQLWRIKKKKLVEMSRKRKHEQMKTIGNISKRVQIPQEKAPDKQHKDSTPKFKKLKRKLLSVDRTEAIGSGTFSRCFPTTYRQDYRVVVKKMKIKDSNRPGEK